MKLHIFGASGMGVSTLGGALGAALRLPYFDSDDYFWEASAPPFTLRCPPARRDARLAHNLARHPSWLVGGSSVGWGGQWLVAFDLVVFLWLPPQLRLQRLHQREHARYGARFLADPSQAARTQAFLEWAAGYDDSSTGGSRTLANHTSWLARLTCPVLELRGDLSIAARRYAIQTRLQELALD